MADEGFLQRWSRRKAAARTPDKEPAPAPDQTAAPEEPATGPDPTAPATAARAEDEDGAIDLAALPDIDTLTYESDFTVFMRKGVPTELRRRALQRLWRSNPTLANLDGLVEYGEDYSKIGTTRAVVRTAYQVGRGMLERIEAKAPVEAAAPASVEASAAAEQPPRAGSPAAASRSAAGAAAEGTPTPVAERQDEAPRPAADGDPSAGARSRPVKKPRPLPRRG